MATVIHVLWHSGDQSPLILPGSLPLDDTGAATELDRHLDDNWKPIIDTDIDGPSSMARSIDEQFKNLGQYGAARRVAERCSSGRRHAPAAAPAASTPPESASGARSRSRRSRCTATHWLA